MLGKGGRGGGKQRNDAPLHSAGEVGGKGRGRGARVQVNHYARGARAQVNHFDREETPPPPPALDENLVQAPEELVTAQDPPSPTGVGDDVDTAQAPQSPSNGEDDFDTAPSPQLPVTDNGAAGDASDHAVDTTLAAKEEVMKTITVAVLALTTIMQDDSVQLEKYKTVCVELAQVKSALVVSDNRVNALCLELQNMKQLQNTADDELAGELHEFIEGLHKKRKQKLLVNEVGCSSDAVALVDVGGGLDMYDDAET